MICDLCTKKLGMQSELHRNNVYQGAELLLLVSMLFLLAIPKCLLIFKETFYYTSEYFGHCIQIFMIFMNQHTFVQINLQLSFYSLFLIDTNNPTVPATTPCSL